jgi:O-methyltransferase involved in polyketide biosynthesis
VRRRHPATQAWKRQRLIEAELAPQPWLTFVPVDFERDDIEAMLPSHVKNAAEVR